MFSTSQINSLKIINNSCNQVLTLIEQCLNHIDFKQEQAFEPIKTLINHLTKIKSRVITISDFTNDLMT